MKYDDAFFDEVYAEADGDPWGNYESEYERRKAERPLAALRDRKPAGKVDRVLDLGCGNGGKTRLVTEAYPDAEVVGVDLSAEALDAARERAPTRPTSARTSSTGWPRPTALSTPSSPSDRCTTSVPTTP